MIVVSQVLITVVLWLAFVREAEPPLNAVQMPAWMLLLAFAITELSVLQIRVGRQSQAVSLSEIPLVLGLFYAAPDQLLVARVLGALLVFVLVHRHQPLKTAYNISVVAIEVTVCLACFHAVLGAGSAAAGSSLGVTGWVALYVAILATTLFVGASLSLVIMISEGPPRLSDLPMALLSGPAMSILVSTIALTGVYALRASPFSAMPLLVSVGVIVLSYRIYAKLSDRYLELERIYRFSQAVTSTPEMDDVLRSVLTEARDLLRTETVSVFFAAGERNHLRVTLSPSNRLERVDEPVDVADRVWSRVAAGSPGLLPRGTARDGEAEAWLRGEGLSEAVAVPLHGEVGIIGALLVGDRSTAVNPYDRNDVELLVTVANHASLALQNGQLVDKLRHEALHDGLTDLPNRKFFQRTLEAALVDQGHGAAVLLLDLDGFKKINDSMGHEGGDLVLREFATRVRAALPKDVLIARLGGDEFAILAPPGAGEGTVREIGELILGSLARPMSVSGKQVRVGASIGAAISPGNGNEESNLLKHADVAMYAAKARGGGLRIYDSSLDGSVAQRLISGAA